MGLVAQCNIFLARNKYVFIFKEILKSDKQIRTWGGDPSYWTAGRPSAASAPMSNSTCGDARVPEDVLKKSSTEVFETNISCPSESRHNSLLIILCWSLLLTINVPKSPSVHCKTVTFRSLDSGSGFCFGLIVGVRHTSKYLQYRTYRLIIQGLGQTVKRQTT